MKKRIVAGILSLVICSITIVGCSLAAFETSEMPTEGVTSEENMQYSMNMNVADCVEECAEALCESDFNTEEYNSINENGFKAVELEPLSTFAADVDTGSYCNLRRMITDGASIDMIPEGAVRVEEMLNYFDWDTKKAEDLGQFKVQYEIADSPWNDTKVLLATIEAKAESKTSRNNFVFLIDVSGSMSYDDDKISMAADSFNQLADTLTEDDIVSVVTYAGESTTLLDSCSGSEKQRIYDAVNRAEEICNDMGGGTNGSGGIETAYKIASKNFIPGGNNRVIIASDGDMNLGVTSQSGLVDLVKGYKNDGIYLTTLGFGAGNYSDANMEQIADAGNGNYFYIDCKDEARRVLNEKMKQNTDVVAKDTKFQLEFNPAMVQAYRQIGYENRQMAASDFADDSKDGGEVGAGAQVTIMYELVLGEAMESELKYQTMSTGNSDELATISIRYQEPNIVGGKSELVELPIKDNGKKDNSADMNFALGVAESAMLIRNSEYKDGSNWEDAAALLNAGVGSELYRAQFLRLMKDLYEKTNATDLKVSEYSSVGKNRLDYTHKIDAQNADSQDKRSERDLNDSLTLRVSLKDIEAGEITEFVSDKCSEFGIAVIASRQVDDDFFESKAIEFTLNADSAAQMNDLNDSLLANNYEYYTE